MRRRIRPLFAVCLAALVPAICPSPVSAQSTTYSTPGTYTLTVPDGVEAMQMSLAGAMGGGGLYQPPNGIIRGATGGNGGFVSGSVAVQAGDTVTVVVGGSGSSGGYNGGGFGVGSFSEPANGWLRAASSGGGATDVRLGGTALADRVAVAAGGGGAGSQIQGPAGNGGAGGGGGTQGVTGLGTPSSTLAPGAGGTQLAGGAGGLGNLESGGDGTLGVGGDGGYVDTSGGAGGGGGGGYYGGGGGGARNDGPGHGGGGGSSLVPPIDGSTTVGGGATTSSPNGSATITWRFATAPTLSLSPQSPSSSNSVTATGEAEAGSTVSLFDNGSCSGTPVATGTAAQYASPGFTRTVQSDQTTTFTARSNLNGMNSACSIPVSYVEDSTAPGVPTLVRVQPALSNQNATTLRGGAENGSTVRAYTTSDCSGTPIVTGGSLDFANGTGPFALTAADNTTTTYKATATDVAGNTSGCSEGATFVEDSSAPSTASFGFTPASPSNDPTASITGNAEAGTYVYIFNGAGCTGTPGFYFASDFNTSGFPFNATPNGSTSFSLYTEDDAGNVSPCTPLTYIHDDIAPAVTLAAPAVGSTTNDSTPEFAGTAGTTARDQAAVTVEVRQGASLVTTIQAQRDPVSGAWSASPAAALTPGAYTAQASQRDDAGNTGTSASVAFTVAAPPVVDPIPPTEPQPPKRCKKGQKLKRGKCVKKRKKRKK